jgi:signal transduction histidine kinase
VPSEAGARTPANLGARLAAVLFAAALAVALVERLGPRTFGRSNDDAAAQAERLREVQDRLKGLGAGLGRAARQAARLPDNAAALAGDRPALSRLFRGLEEAASSDPRMALAVRTPNLTIVAWSGAASEMRGLSAAPGPRTFILSGSVTTTLIVQEPIAGPPGAPPRGFVTAELPVRVQRNLRNEFLRDFDLLSDGLTGVEVHYADVRDPGPDPFPSPSPAPSGGPSSLAALESPDGRILGLARASAASPEVRREAAAVSYRRAAVALALLGALAVFVAGLSRGCALLWGATGLRVVLLAAGGFGRLGLPLAMARTESYSSPTLGPLLATPLDLLATAALVAIVAGVALDRALARPAPLPSAIRLMVALLASLGLAGLTLGLVRDTVVHSQVDLAAVTLIPKTPVHFIIHVALLLILAAAALMTMALWSWARPGLPIRRARTDWSGFDPVTLIGLALGGTALLAILLYPALAFFGERAAREQIEHEYAPLVRELPKQRALLLKASAQAIDDLRLLEDESEVAAPGVEELAFSVWSSTELPQAGASAVEIRDVAGNVLSRFALDLPTLAAAGPPPPLAPEGWTTSREAITVGTAERPVLHARRRLTYDGQARGALHLYLADDDSGLPFLQSRDPYMALYRTPPRSFVRPQPLGFFTFDAQGVLITTSAERPPAIPKEVAARLRAMPRDAPASGEWVTVPVDGSPAGVFFFPAGDRIAGLSFPRPGLGAHAAGLLEAVVALGLAVALVLLLVLAARSLLGRRGFSLSALVATVRSRFALRLFLAFLLLALVPVGVLVLARRIVNERLSHFYEDQALERAAFAQKAVADYALFQRREAPGSRPVSDPALVWVASLIRNDLDVFGRGRLVASSKRELYASGLLSSRLSGSVYRDLVLEAQPETLRTESIGRFSGLVAFVPVPLGGAEPAVLSIPLAVRQREQQATLDELDRAMKLSALGFLVIAGLAAHSMSRRISGPLRALTAATRRIADGDLGARVETENRDEILALVDSFNKMARDLERQRDELERSNRLAAWAEMARQVAHEVKNPLTPIQLSAEHLKRLHRDQSGNFDSVLLECTDTILKQVRKLRGIVTEFSAFARPPATALRPEDLRAVAESAVRPYRRHLPAGVSLEVESAGPLPPVLLDRRLLERALVNVVENALQAVQEGGRVVLRLLTRSEEGRVYVEVEDDGPGMSAEALGRAFEPFFSTKTDGSGLGLALVKKIAEDHGGGVALGSEPGGGTRVSLWLPVARAQATGRAASDLSTAEPRG